MTTTDLAGLIEKLESASEGSNKLDRAIHYAIWNAAYLASDPHDHRLAAKACECPEHPYTQSIDAALTLVPEVWRMYSLSDQRHFQRDEGWWCGMDERNGPASVMARSARTPALALCIAALKARSQS